MKSISKLKDEARRHEQREEWEKAIQAYLQVLRTADEGEAEVELPLYNRVGDLCVRLGKPQEAVRHYEQAADRYAEAGLYNNAIALCNKALRYSPDRLELIRKLGQFSASQGFITDARRYFLDYAERQFKAGKVSEALSALEDFANVSDDAEIRELLGRQLKAHGRINDAVDELRRAHALRLRDGQTDHAETLRAEILAIDPHATIDGGAAAPAGARTSPTTDLPGLVDIEPERTPTPPAAAPDAVEGLEAGALPGDDTAIDSIQLAGFETTAHDGLDEIDTGRTGGLEGLETTTFDFGEVAGEAPALEDLGIEREPTSFDGPTGEEAEAFELPELDGPSAGFDLPTLDEPASDFDLPTLDEPASDFDLPTLDEPAAGFDLPTLDEPAADLDLPTLDEPAADFDLPTLDEPASDFDLPTLDEPASDFDLPTLDEPAPDVELPTLDDAGGDFDLPAPAEADPLPLLDEPAAAADMPAPDEPRPTRGAPSFGDADGGIDLPHDTPESFDLPPIGEGSDAPGADDPSAPRDFGLGGDLPLDLSSLGGAGAFDLPTTDEPEPAWKPEESKFELPELDGDALGLPTWEPEPDATFDLPSFDTPAADEPEEPAAPEEEQATALDAEAETTVGRDDRTEDAAPPVHIPAIELPTWGTGISLDAEDVAEAIDEDDATEPAWVESITDEDDEASPDLPTFAYEDDVDAAGEDDGIVVDEPDRDDGLEAAMDEPVLPVDTDDEPFLTGPTPTEIPPALPDAAAPPAAAEDDDPLGLAAHLAGMGVTPQPAAPVPAGPESDWLDEIADDDLAPEADVADALSVTDEAVDADAGAAVEDVSAEMERAAEAAREMAAAPPPAVEQVTEPPTVEPPPPPPAEQYIDLGALVTGDDEEETTRFRVHETAPTGDEDRDFAELLTQFKSKVHEHLPPEDAAAHYDLGLAFKEMGLIDEAIGEFQVALRAGHMRLKVYEELGQCFLQKEQFNIAEKVLNRALALKFDDELELLGVYYHLGRTYEALGRRDQARDAYERVLGMDINFGDVTDRLSRL